MAAVLQTVALVLAIWTALAFLVAVAVGRTIRQMEPIPVRVRRTNVVDLQRFQAR